MTHGEISRLLGCQPSHVQQARWADTAPEAPQRPAELPAHICDDTPVEAVRELCRPRKRGSRGEANGKAARQRWLKAHCPAVPLNVLAQVTGSRVDHVRAALASGGPMTADADITPGLRACLRGLQANFPGPERPIAPTQPEYLRAAAPRRVDPATLETVAAKFGWTVDQFMAEFREQLHARHGDVDEAQEAQYLANTIDQILQKGA